MGADCQVVDSVIVVPYPHLPGVVFGGGGVFIFATGGHTPGHVELVSLPSVFLQPELNIVITIPIVRLCME